VLKLVVVGGAIAGARLVGCHVAIQITKGKIIVTSEYGHGGGEVVVVIAEAGKHVGDDLVVAKRTADRRHRVGDALGVVEVA